MSTVSLVRRALAEDGVDLSHQSGSYVTVGQAPNRPHATVLEAVYPVHVPYTGVPRQRAQERLAAAVKALEARGWRTRAESDTRVIVTRG